MLRRLFLFCVLLFVTLGGGRIASSDGNTMFALSQSLMRGRLAIDEGWNGREGRDGRFYAKADPGLAVLALPWVAVGEVTAGLVPAGEAVQDQRPRLLTSTFNAFVGASAVVAFVVLLHALGYSIRAALVLGIGLAVATPLLPYSKSFMREPLLMLAVLLALLDLRREHWLRAGAWIGAGMLVKASMVLQVPLIAVYVVLATGHGRGVTLGRFLAGPVVAGLLLAIYNWLRFESVFDTGYDPTVDVFSTPLLVGLYGQLLSSGKSLFLYAPLAAAALWGYGRYCRRHGWQGALIIAILAVNLIFHARFASWAGEGSWGPRYVLPFLPLFLLPAAELLDGGGRLARRAVMITLVLGVVVQFGGTAIYFGSYMRDIGEYPYQRNFTDPLFMHRSHFVPNYSPVVGHWRLLGRNVGRLAGPDRLVLQPRRAQESDGRLPLATEEQDQLRHVVDFWFCYGIYAGMPPAAMWGAALVMLLATAGAGVALRRSVPPA